MKRLIAELTSYIREAANKPKTPADQAKADGYKSLGRGYWSKSGSPPAEASTRGGVFKILSAAEKTAAKKNLGGTEQNGTTPTIPDVPQSAAVQMTDAPGNIPARPIDPKAAQADKKKYDSLMSAIKNNEIEFIDDDQKERAGNFMKLWQAFVSAPTYEEQVKAVNALVDNGLIEGGGGEKKVYIADTVGLPYKGMCGKGGTEVTKLMLKIVKDKGIDLPPRAGSTASKQAAESGPTNEAGVAALLDPSDENNAIYEERKRRYAEVGGNTEEMDKLNQSAAEAIRSSLPAGAKIIKAVQVGGSHELQRKYGITDPRIDPTDVVIEYELNGKKVIEKLSAKIYADPDRITMKNAGLTDAGVTYIGQPEGTTVDRLFNKLRSDPKLDWTQPGLNEKQIKERKNKFRLAYTQAFSKEMEALAKDPDPNSPGQKRLTEMWKRVHGCGQNVGTLVVNKTTGKSEVKGPNHYCEPKLPFKVKYNGTKVVIEMDSGGPQTLEIVLKTETEGGAKLLFNHVVKKPKKQKVPKKQGK